MRKKEQNLRDQALVWKVFPNQYFLLAPTLEFAFCKLHPRRAKARPKDEGVFPKSTALVRYAGLRAQGAGGLGDRYLLDERGGTSLPQAEGWNHCLAQVLPFRPSGTHSPPSKATSGV